MPPPPLPAGVTPEGERSNQESGYEFHEAWMARDFPRMLAVTFQHPTPYFDDSYGVNSPNGGPYGDAIMAELIPEPERRFRTIPEARARVLTGSSTGGWGRWRSRFTIRNSSAGRGRSHPIRWTSGATTAA